MDIVVTQNRILALITLPLWLGGYFFTSSGIVGVNHVLTPHSCDLPQIACSNWSFAVLAGGLGLLAATVYAFVMNHKKESKRMQQQSSPDTTENS
jgi:cytochrome c biogenesis factor